jgi:hypothetical protein
MKKNNNPLSYSGFFFRRLYNTLQKGKGSILTTVIIISAVVFILATALLSVVNNTNTVNLSVDNSEKAYLAARSGITLVGEAGADTSFAQKLYDSKLDKGTTLDDSNAITFTLDDPDDNVDGNVTLCKLWAVDAGTDTNSNGELIQILELKCTGISGGKEFTLTRKINLTQKGVSKKTEINPTAYTHYGNGDIKIVGGIEGDVIIIGDGNVYNTQATLTNRMHNLVCTNQLELENSSSVYESIATGKHLILNGSARVDENVRVGSYALDDNLQFTDTLYPNIFASIQNSDVGGQVICEGTTILGNSACIYSNNAKSTVNITDPDASPYNANGTYMWNTIYDVERKADGSSKDAVLSGGPVYIGYFAKASDNYQVGTTPPADGAGAGMVICGNVVANGDVYINATCTIYGDIIANGNVYFQSGANGAVVHGNIYAAGNVEFNQNTTTSSTFPNSSSQVFAGGDVTTINTYNGWPELVASSSSNLGASVPKMSTFSGNYMTGAAEWFKSNYEGSPKPTTTFPYTKFDSAPRIDATQTVENTVTCEQWNPQPGCTYQVEATGEACHSWDCTDLSHWSPNPDDTSVCYWCPVHNQLGEHQKMTHTAPVVGLGYYYHPTHQLTVSEEVTGGGIHITETCVLEGDFNLNNLNDILYFDCTPDTPGGQAKKIDVLLKQGNSIKIGSSWQPGSIIINDYGGEGRVRLFMEQDTALTMGDNNQNVRPGVYVVDSASKDATDLLSNPPTSVYDSRLTRQRVPQFYIFGPDSAKLAESGTSANITISVGLTGSIPGYILMPDVDINANASSHPYQDSTVVGQDPSNPENTSDGNYPAFFGMLMCNSLDFAGNNTTFVKFDKRLTDTQIDPVTGEETISDVRDKFNKALANDSVMIADAGLNGDDDEGADYSTTQWVIDSSDRLAF